MADRNEIIRVILEGRDRLSNQLRGARNEVNKLDSAIKNLKKNKVEDFPLFGGGSATRGPGGQFIKKEEISKLDQARRGIDRLNRSIRDFRRQRLSEGEFALFGGGRAVRGEGGRFVKKEDLSALDKLKAKLNDVDKAILRVRRRIARGPLVEGEEAGAGATRLARGPGGQFVRASDLSLVQRLGRELNVVRKGMRDIGDEMRRGFAIEKGNVFRSMADGVIKLDNSIGSLLNKLRRGTFPQFGGGRSRQGPGGQFVTVEDISLLNSAKNKIDDVTNAFRRFRALRIAPIERFIFGGATSGRGEGRRIIRVEQVSLIERAKNGLNDISNALTRIRTRIIRGPLVEGEEPGAGSSRLTRNAAGQYVRAQDLTLVQRLRREFNAFSQTLDRFKERTKFGLFGSPGVVRDPDTKRFKSNLTLLGRLARGYQNASERIQSANRRISESQKQAATDTIKGIRAGIQLSENQIGEIDKVVAKTKEQAQANRDELRETQELEKIKLAAENQRRREQIFSALEVRREEARKDIEIKKEELRQIEKTEETVARRQELSEEIASIQRARREEQRRRRENLAAVFQRRRANLAIKHVEQRRELVSPDVTDLEADLKRVREKFVADAETSFGRLGRRAGLAFGDIRRGARDASLGLNRMNKDVRVLTNGFTRFGYAVGSLFKRFDQLVNLRWLFITGVISIFLSVVVQLGTALVALASSAIQAGAALGGALLAGAAQALPVVGLLAAALNRVNAVFDAVKLNDKANKDTTNNLDQIRNAGQRLADAQYSLKRAIESVGDAQYDLNEANKDVARSYKDVRDATKELVQAKKQASRDIVDANLEERDAALSLKEAEFGVLDAKQKLREEEEKQRKGGQDVEEARAALREAQDRLKIARSQADQAQISPAQQQVTLAEQNLNAIQSQVDTSKRDIAEAQTAVTRAQLTKEQAAVRDKRAREDAALARQRGIKGAEIVKNAEEQLKNAIDGVAKAQRQVVLSNRAVRDALHSVAIAHREVADAERDKADAKKGSSAADKAALKAYQDLSPAEKRLYQALKRIRKTFQEVFAGTNKKDGILAPITDAFTQIVNAVDRLLRDPKIIKAAGDLAKAIGTAITRFARFLSSGEVKKLIIFFTEQATRNLPTVATILLNILKTFLNIAKAATPIFNHILDRILKASTGLKNVTDDRTGLSRRRDEGAGGLAGQVSTLRQSKIDEFPGGAEKHLNSWIKRGIAIGKVIIALTGSGAATTGQTLIDKLADKLDQIANWINTHDKEVTDFFDNAGKSIEGMARTLGKLATALVKAFRSDEFAKFGELMTEIIIPGLLLFIQILGKLSRAVLYLINLPVVGKLIKWYLEFLVAEKALNKVFPATQLVTDGIKKLGSAFIRGVGVTGAYRKAIQGVTRAFELKKKTKKNAIVFIGKAAYSSLVRLIGILRVLASFIYQRLLAALLALRISVRLLVSATVIGALITAAILVIEHWDKVKKYAKILGDFLLKTFKRVTDWVKDNWKKILIAALLAPFLPAGLIFLGLYKFNDKLPGPLKTIIKGAGKVAEIGGAAASKAGGLFGKVIGRAKGGIVPGFAGGTGGVPGKTDTVPAMLTPGEWVLNKEQQKVIAKALHISVEQAKAYIFGTNVGSGRPLPAGISRGLPGTIGTRGRGAGAASLPAGISRGLPGKTKNIGFKNFNLISQEDEDGNTIWFIQLANGTFGQVTGRDAQKIQNTNGEWIPGYVKRSTAGYMRNIQDKFSLTGAYSFGGIVSPIAVQRFATGGVVQQPGFSGGIAGKRNTINQNFQVTTQGETDWGYVMRLGAVHAQESF